MGCVYVVYNRINDFIYIGKTKYDHITRFKQHIKEANLGKSNTRFHKAIRKYGADNFSCLPLIKRREITSEDALYEAENFIIKTFKENGANLYNLSEGGVGRKGHSFSEESRLKLSSSVKKLWEDPKYRERANKNKSENLSKRWTDERFLSENKLTTISVEQVLLVKDLFLKGNTRKEISKIVNKPYGQICAIVSGRQWNFITKMAEG